MGRTRCRQLVVFMILIAAPGSGRVLGQVGTAALTGEVRDQQSAAIPGATVTLVHAGTGAERTATTDRTGTYRFLALSAGTYYLKVSLQGFETERREGVPAAVDTTTRLEPITLAVRGLSEAVEVHGSAASGTVNAAMGNVIGKRQILALPLEARNPAGLMSLQPGAVFLPTGDPRSGAVSGARSDQSNVTLDGVDVNDPELGTAYTSVLRMPLDAIAEFRVTTSNFGAEQGRSSGGQISLVTQGGSNAFHGAAYGMIRNTATSSNEYFLKLTQLGAGEPSVPPTLDKQIYGAALGGPVKKNRTFFYAHYEQLRELSESPVTRSVPSNTLRDGIVVYQCADPAACPGGTVRGVTGAPHQVEPGYYGMSPTELAAIDPLGIGASLPLMEAWKSYPAPNDPGADGRNLMAYRFAAPVANRFKTLASRLDHAPSGSHRFFGRVNLMHDAVETAPQFSGQEPASIERVRNWGFAVGHDWVMGPTRVNSLRYGFTKISSDTAGHLNSDTVTFLGLDPLAATTPTGGRSIPTLNITDDFSWVAGSHTLKFGGNLRFTRASRYSNANSYYATRSNPYWDAGSGQDYIPGRPTCTTGGCDAVPAVAEQSQCETT